MEKQIPKTKKEAFAQLDAMLSDEDKKMLVESEDLISTHFSLGLWIRNNWIYPLSDEEGRTFMKLFADDEESQNVFLFFDPDSVSGDIIEKYVEYLKKRTAKMNITENQPQWDAKRLVQQYLKLANLIKSYHGKPFEEIIWSNQIRIKRIASALCAFMGMRSEDKNPLELIFSVFGDWHFTNLFEYSSLLEKDKEKLLTLVKESMNDDIKYEYLMSTFREKRYDREQMLHSFLGFRVKTERLLSYFEGALEAGLGGILAYHLIQGMYFPTLRDHNDKMDEMIVILLGDKFKQSFSVEELEANYGYPKETDDELIEWECDNW